MLKKVFNRNRGFTLIELIMIMVIIAILAAIAVAKFIDMREEARDARAELNIGALRSAASIYYAKTAIPGYQYLCNADQNPYRNETVPAPCFPANCEELESLLTSPPVWGEGEGACYDSITGQVTQCD